MSSEKIKERLSGQELIEGQFRLRVVGEIPGSSTGKLVYGDLVDGGGEPVEVIAPWGGPTPVVVKTVAPIPFFGFDKQENVGVLMKKEAGMVGEAQTYNPYIGVVRVKKTDGVVSFVGDEESDAEFGMVMYKLPEENWMPRVIEAMLETPDWQAGMVNLGLEVCETLTKMQQPLEDASVLENNTAEMIGQWFVINAFGHMDALDKDETELSRKIFGGDEEVIVDDPVLLTSEQKEHLGELKTVFEQVRMQNAELLDKRKEGGKIMQLNGDAKAPNMWWLDGNGSGKKVVGMVDGAFFMDENGKERPFNKRDMMWDPAYFSVTTAAEVAFDETKGPSDAVKFLADMKQKLGESQFFDPEDLRVMDLYLLYAFYVQTDTLYRVAENAVSGGRLDDAGIAIYQANTLLATAVKYGRSIQPQEAV